MHNGSIVWIHRGAHVKEVPHVGMEEREKFFSIQTKLIRCTHSQELRALTQRAATEAL